MIRQDLGELLTELQLFGYGVELGVASGWFSDIILRTSKLKLLFSIDKWDDHHDHGEYRSAVNLLKPHEERSVVLKMSFIEAVSLFQDQTFDFIYIDGYAQNGQDNGETLSTWWPKLKTGGVFSGHDYDENNWYETFKEVNNFVDRYNLELQVTDEDFPSWFCRKLPIFYHKNAN